MTYVPDVNALGTFRIEIHPTWNRMSKLELFYTLYIEYTDKCPPSSPFFLGLWTDLVPIAPLTVSGSQLNPRCIRKKPLHLAPLAPLSQKAGREAAAWS